MKRIYFILLTFFLLLSLNATAEPPYINSKHDFWYVLSNYNSSEYLPIFLSLYENSFSWKSTRCLGDDQNLGIIDATHRIILQDATFLQQELLPDEYTRLILLGITRDEILLSFPKK
jgi:hypothetical protein